MAENKSVQGDCCGCVYRDERERCRRLPPVVVMFAHRDVDRHEWLSSAVRGAVQQVARVRRLTERLDALRNDLFDAHHKHDSLLAEIDCWRRLPWWRRAWRALRGRL